MKTEICVYCRNNTADTVNYIPPKNALFQPALHPKMLTVPCCSSCKEKFIRDNEYFLVFLTFIAFATNHANRYLFLEKVSEMPLTGSTRLFFDYVSNMHNLQTICLPSGLFQFDQPGFSIDRSRVRSVAEWIVRSLVFQNIGVLTGDLISGLTTTTDPHVLALENEKYVCEMFDFLRAAHSETLGEGDVLKYRSAYADYNPTLSTWLLNFFGIFNAVVVVQHEKMERFAVSRNAG